MRMPPKLRSVSKKKQLCLIREMIIHFGIVMGSFSYEEFVRRKAQLLNDLVGWQKRLPVSQKCQRRNLNRTERVSSNPAVACTICAISLGTEDVLWKWKVHSHLIFPSFFQDIDFILNWIVLTKYTHILAHCSPIELLVHFWCCNRKS